MNKEERKEYQKKYYETHKNDLKEYHKKYREAHKDKVNENRMKSYRKNRDKEKERFKKYNEKNNAKILERKSKYRKNNHEIVMLCNRICRYYSHDFYRYISLENYLTIMKLGDYSLKRSIMVKLGKGLILEDEAVTLSGMVWTEEDQKQLNEYLKRSKNERPSSKP